MVKKKERSVNVSGKPKHSLDVNRDARNKNKSGGTARTSATVRRLKMYKTRPKRDAKGTILKHELQSKELPSTRIQPDRRWFGNTRVVNQKELEFFREELQTLLSSNYNVIMKERKLPMSLLNDHQKDGETEIHEVLANVTFEELQKARSDGSHLVNQKPKVERKGKRENKNRPIEISSKKPLRRFREVIQAPKKVIRDPRFESLCGTLDVDGFKKRYNFLYDSELPKEKEQLKKEIKKTKDPEVVSGLKDRVAWIDKQLKSASIKHTDKEILVKHKKKEREAAKQGKQPYYLKKSEIRKQELVEKFKELKASGKLASFIEKKRRKNAAKDHRFMPYRRPNEDKQET